MKNKYTGKNHEGPARSSPYPVSRLGSEISLIDLAKQIDTADNFIHTKTNAKLNLIAEQIKALQDTAREVLQQAQQDQLLHRAECQFQRKPGHIYHLYRRSGRDDSAYFSMLAPHEWGGKPPHEYVASYRLENDMSWSEVEEMDQPADSDLSDTEEIIRFIKQLS